MIATIIAGAFVVAGLAIIIFAIYLFTLFIGQKK